ncbi:hypothetical protein HY772_05650, partial [Candidatus Woesearchaeota archaeon]|nr:hypothetical protein [Candidatus Woesearchaeota archaeon]
MKRAVDVILFFLKYGPHVLTVGLGAWFAFVVLRTAGIAQQEILAWILTILTLLATALLSERFFGFRRIENLSEQIYQALLSKHPVE